MNSQILVFVISLIVFHLTYLQSMLYCICLSQNTYFNDLPGSSVGCSGELISCLELWQLVLYWLVCFSGGYSSYKFNFAYLLKKWTGAAQWLVLKRVKLLGSWFQPSGWTYRAWQVSQFGCFLAEEQRSVGILLLITSDAACQHVSIKCSPVVTFCSFHFGVCWFTGVLTAGTCVISVSTLSNDTWPICCSSHIPSIRPASNSWISDWLMYCSKISCLASLNYCISHCQIVVGGGNCIKLA